MLFAGLMIHAPVTTARAISPGMAASRAEDFLRQVMARLSRRLSPEHAKGEITASDVVATMVPVTGG
jgi:hypothetical protein